MSQGRQNSNHMKQSKLSDKGHPNAHKNDPHLKKSLKIKERKMHKLAHPLEDYQKQYQNIDYSNKKRISAFTPYGEHGLHSKKQIVSDALNKQKNFPGHVVNPEENLFKNGSSFGMKKKRAYDLKLPSLERKNIFQEDMCEEAEKPKVLKISMDKLRKLNPDEVRKKFQTKFRMINSQSLPS